MWQRSNFQLSSQTLLRLNLSHPYIRACIMRETVYYHHSCSTERSMIDEIWYLRDWQSVPENPGRQLHWVGKRGSRQKPPLRHRHGSMTGGNKKQVIEFGYITNIIQVHQNRQQNIMVSPIHHRLPEEIPSNQGSMAMFDYSIAQVLVVRIGLPVRYSIPTSDPTAE